MSEQERIKQLEDLLIRYYGMASIGDNMVNPTPAEECNYVESMRKLMEETEYLIPELKQDDTDDEPYISDEEEYGGPKGEVDDQSEYTAWATWARSVS